MASERLNLRVGIFSFLPWYGITKGDNNTINTFGVLDSVLKIMAQYMNFDYVGLQPPDKVWGHIMANGSSDGLMGMLARKDVEFCLGPFSITPARAALFDFTVPIYHDLVGIVTPRPTVENDIEGFLKPFSAYVWLSTMCSLLAISISMSAVAAMEERVFPAVQPTNDVTSKSVMWTIKAFTQEGSEWLPKKDAGRLIVSTWLLASLVFMTSYSGTLTSMLTAPKVPIPIDSLEDLASQNKISWKMKGSTTYSYNYLKESTNPIHQRVFNGASGTITYCWEFKEDIAEGKYATLCAGLLYKKLTSWDFSLRGQCRMYMAQEPLFSNDPNALAFLKGSPYLEKANKILHSLKEAGLIDYWLQQHVKNITYCMRPPSADRSADAINALNLEVLGGSFILFGGGQILALITFIGEMTFVHLMYRPTKKRIEQS